MNSPYLALLKGKKMFYRNVLLLVSLILMITSSVLFAKTPSVDSYQTLVTKVKNGDTHIDFGALRIAYTQTSQYNPYGKDENVPLMFEALNRQEFSKAIQYAQSVLEKNYVDIDAHYVLLSAYGETGNNERSEFHRSVAMGLIDSIATGDGSSPETALKVINVREEYIMLNIAGLEMQKQTLQQFNDKNYDVFDVINRESGQTFTLYFDVSIPFEWLNKSLKNKE